MVRACAIGVIVAALVKLPAQLSPGHLNYLPTRRNLVNELEILGEPWSRQATQFVDFAEVSALVSSFAICSARSFSSWSLGF